jgi:crotonobetainyl-CoA:carnitine CoA-transferase CaiB-like acyl-CoA transferase
VEAGGAPGPSSEPRPESSPEPSSEPRPGPLAGVVVLDFSRVLAGPYCTMLLGDLGATILKIEEPGEGDGTRGWGPPWVGAESAYFLSVNRNKQSITLDLTTEAGQDLARRLAQRADLVIENFRRGTMARFGLDYPTLSALRPGLVYASITGYGQTGPHADLPGYDFTIQAEGGLMSITGPEAGEPFKVGVAVGDVVTGLQTAVAVLSALYHQQRTGEGQYIDVALLDSQVGWLANVAQGYLATGELPKRHGNAHPNIVPYGTFPASDGRLAVGGGTDAHFRRICALGAREDLADDPRYATNAGRVKHREALTPELNRLFSTRTVHEWVTALRQVGVPVAPVRDLAEVFSDPQLLHRNMVQEVVHDTEGPLQMVGPVPKLSETPATIRLAPPPLGAHTDHVLTTWLGCSPADLSALRAQGVIR